jgi:hypothetical protein
MLGSAAGSCSRNDGNAASFAQLRRAWEGSAEIDQCAGAEQVSESGPAGDAARAPGGAPGRQDPLRLSSASAG